MKALFVVNRRSGVKRRGDVVKIIGEACKWEHEIFECETRGDLDSAITEAFDVVFAVGGDGTVHEVAKRLIGREIALGIVPTGSGNGFARHVGLPSAPRDSLLACRGGRIETIDTAEVNGLPFVGVMGLGFDAWVADYNTARPHQGIGMATPSERFAARPEPDTAPRTTPEPGPAPTEVTRHVT